MVDIYNIGKYMIKAKVPQDSCPCISHEIPCTCLKRSYFWKSMEDCKIRDLIYQKCVSQSQFLVIGLFAHIATGDNGWKFGIGIANHHEHFLNET